MVQALMTWALCSAIFVLMVHTAILFSSEFREWLHEAQRRYIGHPMFEASRKASMAIGPLLFAWIYVMTLPVILPVAYAYELVMTTWVRVNWNRRYRRSSRSTETGAALNSNGEVVLSPIRSHAIIAHIAYEATRGATEVTWGQMTNQVRAELIAGVPLIIQSDGFGEMLSGADREKTRKYHDMVMLCTKAIGMGVVDAMNGTPAEGPPVIRVAENRQEEFPPDMQ